MWWVIPEGFLGQLVNGLTSGPALNVFTVKQSATRPRGAVAGPFRTQAEAQAVANQKNGGSQATPGNITSQATLTGLNSLGDLAQRLTQSTLWVRVGEAFAGGILLYVGLKAFFPTQVSALTAPVKKAGKAAMFL